MSAPRDPRPDATWAQVRALFEAAAQRPRADREAWLRAQPDLAPGVLDEVLRLLAQLTDEGGVAFPDTPLWITSDAAPAAGPSLAGLHLGAWQLESRLGEGGMGEVWAARRADGRFEARAAVKLLRAGLGDPRLAQRFAQEQQALARLRHPNIAQLLDAGVAPDGRPYFVMELVEGRTIDHAAAALDLRGRIELFLQLVDAVSYLHRQLLVHRDLKPGNVLVDAQGQVRLLDFGIAKALDVAAQGREDASLTTVEQRPYTPAWASPEQVRGEPIGTATDLYSLGVLLYALLTGDRPYARGATSPVDVARAVLDEEPTRPSQLTGDMTSAGTPGSAAALAHVSPAPARLLRGDLDNIVLKALEKDPARRYPTADALAADLRAHLAGFPVSARPRDWRYVAGRFVARHRVAVPLAAVALLAIGVAGAAAAWEAHVANVARRHAEARLAAIKRFTHDVVFRYGDAIDTVPGGLQVKGELIATAIGHLDGLVAEAGDDPDLLADLAMAYGRLADLQGGNTGKSLDRFEEAGRHLDKALGLARRVAGTKLDDVEFAAAYLNMQSLDATRLQRRRELPAAMDVVRTADAFAARALALHPGDVMLRTARADALMVRARLEYMPSTQDSLLQPQAAMETYAQAATTFESLTSTNPTRHGWVTLGHAYYGRALCLLALDRGPEALPWLRRSLEATDRVIALQPDHVGALTDAGIAWDGYAQQLLRAGDAAGAVGAADRTQALFAQAIRLDPQATNWPRLATFMRFTQARALGLSGRHADALVALKAAEGASSPYAAGMPPALQATRVAWVDVETARELAASGRLAEARVRAEQGRREVEAVVAAPQPPREAWVTLARAQAVLAAMSRGEARAASLERSRAAWERAAAMKPLAAFERRERDGG